MLELPAIAEFDAAGLASIAELKEPAVFRGLISDWPVVAAAAVSDQQLCSYLLRLDNGAPIEAFIAPAQVRGRFFYSATMSGFNFERGNLRLRDLLALLTAEAVKKDKAGIYAGSVPAASVVPGFGRENELPFLADKRTEPRLWLGNETNIATHFDEANNLACVAAGHRRFVLFPPDQVANLYVGPIDVTVAGLPASMVDMRAPDLEQYPLFRTALDSARSAVLGPGDAIYVPALWWHHVEATDPLNLLVNYWWQDGAADAGSPFASIAHGLLTISHLPVEQRRAWRAFFDHYVFQLDHDPAVHIPPHARGVLGESSSAIRRTIKEFLLRALHR